MRGKNPRQLSSNLCTTSMNNSPVRRQKTQTAVQSGGRQHRQLSNQEADNTDSCPVRRQTTQTAVQSGGRQHRQLSRQEADNTDSCPIRRQTTQLSSQEADNTDSCPVRRQTTWTAVLSGGRQHRQLSSQEADNTDSCPNRRQTTQLSSQEADNTERYPVTCVQLTSTALWLMNRELSHPATYAQLSVNSAPVEGQRTRWTACGTRWRSACSVRGQARSSTRTAKTSSCPYPSLWRRPSTKVSCNVGCFPVSLVAPVCLHFVQ